MKRFLSLSLIMVFILSASCVAAPVSDYSLGHLKFDVETGFSSFSPDYTDSEIGYGIGLTAGLGFGFAGQYSYSKVNGDNGLKNHQLNLYDHLLGPVGVFIGASKTEPSGADSQNGIVFGVSGTVPVAPRTSAYVVLSSGTHVSGSEFGLGYALSKNADLNLLYRNIRYTGLKLANDEKGDNGDIVFKGFFSGISYKL